MDVTVGSGNGNLDFVVGWVLRACDRQMKEIGFRIRFLLPSVLLPTLICP
jgi:hypothetical protein